MDTASFVTSLATSFFIFLLLTLLYAILSRRPGNFPVYYPALLLHDHNPEEAALRGPFAWFRDAWGATEKDIVRFSGVDTAVYINFLDAALRILGFSALFCVPVLVTLSVRGQAYVHRKQQSSADPNGNSTFFGFDRLAMGNVEEKQRVIWVFGIGAYWLSIVTYLVLWSKYRHVSKLRSAELNSRVMPERFAVLVRDIPSTQQVDEYFKAIHPDTYEACIHVPHLKSAAKLWSKLESAKGKLAKAETAFEGSRKDGQAEGTRPHHRTGTFGLYGSKVDSIEFYKQQVAELKKSHEEERGRTTASDKQRAAAILVFNNPTSAAASSQCIYSASANKWLTSAAPEPRQVVWENLGVAWYQRQMRKAAVYTIVALIILFYMIPIGFVSALSTLDKLESLAPFIKSITKLRVLRTVLQAYLPQLALLVFLALLPNLLLHLSKFEGIVSRGHLERAVAGKYFYFNVLNVFLGITLGSSLFDTFKSIEKKPNSAITLLGQAIPPASSFFITFIALKFFVGYGLQVSRLVPLVIFHLKKKYMCKTQDQVRAAWAPRDFGYSTRVPGDMLVLTIAMCYAVIAPMVLPFAIVYFAFGWIIARHEALKVLVPSYESYGRMWPHMFNRVVAALCISQVAMLGYFIIKKFVYAPLLVPLPVATLLFAYMCNKIYYPGFKDTPLAVTAKYHLPALSTIVEAYTPTCLVPDNRKQEFEHVRQSAV